MDYVDQSKPCRDCKEDFIFTAGEQRFYQERGFNPPVRCKKCRDTRKGGTQTSAAPQATPTPQMQPERYQRPMAAARVDEDPWGDDRHHKRRAHKTRKRWQQENEDYDDY